MTDETRGSFKTFCPPFPILPLELLKEDVERLKAAASRLLLPDGEPKQCILERIRDREAAIRRIAP